MIIYCIDLSPARAYIARSYRLKPLLLYEQGIRGLLPVAPLHHQKRLLIDISRRSPEALTAELATALLAPRALIPPPVVVLVVTTAETRAPAHSDLGAPRAHAVSALYDTQHKTRYYFDMIDIPHEFDVVTVVVGNDRQKEKDIHYEEDERRDLSTSAFSASACSVLSPSARSNPACSASARHKPASSASARSIPAPQPPVLSIPAIYSSLYAIAARYLGPHQVATIALSGAINARGFVARATESACALAERYHELQQESSYDSSAHQELLSHFATHYRLSHTELCRLRQRLLLRPHISASLKKALYQCASYSEAHRLLS